MDFLTHNLLPRDGVAFYQENYIPANESAKLFRLLFNNVQWEEKTIKLFGRVITQPRLIAYYGDDNKNYKYSGTTLTPTEWSKELFQIRDQIQGDLDCIFNSALLNLYRNGGDYMGWHSDNEKSLGKHPVIASISLGARRKFKLKHKYVKELKRDIMLDAGSLLIMQGNTQEYWSHSVPKKSTSVDPRINISFREVKI